ncbi:MAG: magnesium chelatase subunit H [Candidatus Methanospirare jalkutatii]|nr:magnesium chelatase subunit H [Candidatus Methanospirare jalkutatii]
MRLVAIVWRADIPLLRRACEALQIDLVAWSREDLRERLDECLKSLERADFVLLHPSHEDAWSAVEVALEKIRVPAVAIGYDASLWSLSNVKPEVVATANAYFVKGGYENVLNMLKFLVSEILGRGEWKYEPPKEERWQGFYHPDAESVFGSIEDYLSWYATRSQGSRGQKRAASDVRVERKPRVGILFYRTYFLNEDLEVVDALIREFERQGFDVISAFCTGMGDKEAGAKTSGEVIKEFVGKVDALVNLQPVFLATVEGAVSVLKELDVPVFHPVLLYYKTVKEWREDPHGLSAAEVGWSVAMPEFEGLIEPLVVGACDEAEKSKHVPVDERVRKIVRRVKKWVELRKKPKAERRVAFILHNKPCASVEATVGSASHLDALESVARILKRMRDEGYAVENPPENGKALIDEIMRRKAISEFRWTTVEEIVKKGGALALISKEEYEEWFNCLDEEVRKKVCDVWGDPPGDAMVFEGKLVVTGLKFGNAIVCVQPKRGCAGARCDGQVCKILHDPEVPPPHQYLATYKYLEENADVVVHVGTHGNLEFLPGKSVGLSERCFPDVAIGDLPHLYIYNSDNPPEGTIAKRRSYATLIDHMQAVLTESGLYGELKELEDAIAEYRKVKGENKARESELRKQIISLLRKTRLFDEIKNELRRKVGERCGKVCESDEDFGEAEFDAVLDAIHKALSRIYDTQIPDGMHIFGEKVEGERKVNFIYAILRRDFRKALLRKGSTAEADEIAKGILRKFLSGEESAAAEIAEMNAVLSGGDEILRLKEKCDDISARLDATDEMGALLHGLDAGYVEPGPSGLITKGKVEVLPTGRNFYSLDPFKIPTKAAWEVGKRLADALLRKYEEECGEIPENIAMYWMASDIMWADGEQLAQILYLIGVEPVWDASGRVHSFRIIPLEELKRPRIDVTVRVSGIIRDCFYNCIEFLDRAIRAVSALEEPPSLNFLRKHAEDAERAEGAEGAEGVKGAGGAEGAEKYARIFSSKPGTYGSGVNLAVYASAWKTPRDLAEVFIVWNGYAYGENMFGEPAHKTLKSQLKTVSATFNKTTTDEYDMLGCCCYFSTHGGLTVAAREISGKKVIALYGDTRNEENVEVRTLADEIRRVVRTKLLNPKWIEGMKRHGYKGAGDISKRIGRVYGWEATTEEVDDWIFDEIARTFVLDDEMRAFFERENPWALEEIGRRLIEAHERGLWKASEDVLDALRGALLEVEGWMEEKMGVIEGEFQGSSIDVVTKEEVKAWKKKYEEVLKG